MLEKMKTRSSQTCWLLVFIFVFFYSSLTNLFFAAAHDTISSGQSLTFNQTLISKDGKFELGFFTPGTTSLNHYIGIWYKNDPSKTVVWVANRDNPLTDNPTSSEFKLLEKGNLVLLNQYSELPIWSTESASNNGNVSSEAMLGDDGNLVLRRTGPSAEVIWQSFDYPTDTILPGAKIGYNRITKIRQSLTSWRSPNDPAKGLYSVQLDPDENEFFIKSNPNGNRSWSSGAWNGKLFSLVPEMVLVFDLNYRYVESVNESYFTYTISNSSIPFRLVMNLSGQIQHLKWPQSSQSWNLFWSQPIQHSCEAYTGYCGQFSVCDEKKKPLCRCLNGFMPRSPKDWNFSNFYDGCVWINNWQCDDEVEFLQDYQQLGFFNQQLIDAIRSAHDWKNFCLDDCSCNAYAFNSSCLLWKSNKFTLQQLQKDEAGQPPLYIQLRVAASKTPGPTSEIPSTTSGGKKPLKPYLIVVIAGSIFVSIFSCISFAYIMKQRGKLEFKTTETSLADYLPEEHEPEQGKLELPLFDFNTITTATNNFSNKLGQGGFGPVYKILRSTNYGLEEVYMHMLFKFFNYFSAGLQNLRNFLSNLWRIGKLIDGREIAVKKLSSCSGQGEEEFKNELMLISKLQHRNLVRLLGYCICKEEKILLYEYMQNKSLDAILFDATKRILLDWSKRFSIIDGIARGLLYLHRDSRLKVIHRDLKASNVLLDEDMNPKISDFGLARIFGEKQTLGNTNRVVGTYGYMSPEYALEGIFSEKSDVFSFGVLLLEIVSSKKSSNLYTLEESYNLIGYVWRMWNESKVLEIMDPTLAESYNLQELMRCIHIGLLCVQDHALDRPTMSAFVSMLNSEGTLPLPKEAAFIIDRMQFSNILFNTSSDAVSINRVTVTNLEGR